VHDMVSDGRLVGVYIDGCEYPPVDMRGEPRKGVSTCLANDLGAGRHRLALKVLLPWRSGTMSVRGIDVAR